MRIFLNFVLGAFIIVPLLTVLFGGWGFVAGVIALGVAMLQLTLKDHRAAVDGSAAPVPSASIFEPEGVIGAIPYKVADGGAVDAMMPGGMVRFKNFDDFMTAAGNNASPVPEGSRVTSVAGPEASRDL